MQPTNKRSTYRIPTYKTYEQDNTPSLDLFMSQEHLEEIKPGFAKYLKEHGIKLAENDFPMDMKTGERYSFPQQLIIARTKDLGGQYSNDEIANHQSEITEYAKQDENSFMFTTNGCKLGKEEIEIGKLLNDDSKKIVTDIGIGKPFTKEELKTAVKKSQGKIKYIEVDGVPQILVAKRMELSKGFEMTESCKLLRQNMLKDLIGKEYGNIITTLVALDDEGTYPEDKYLSKDIYSRLRNGDPDALNEIDFIGKDRRTIGNGHINIGYYFSVARDMYNSAFHPEFDSIWKQSRETEDYFINDVSVLLSSKPIKNNLVKDYKIRKAQLIDELCSSKNSPIVKDAYEKYTIKEKVSHDIHKRSASVKRGIADHKRTADYQRDADNHRLTDKDSVDNTKSTLESPAKKRYIRTGFENPHR